MGLTPVGAVLSVGNLGQTFFSNVGASVSAVIKTKSIKKLWEKYEIKENVPYEARINNEVETIKLENVSFGYDGKNDVFVDMLSAGIIDPLLVTKTALISASSVAGTLLTTECLVCDENSKED